MGLVVEPYPHAVGGTNNVEGAGAGSTLWTAQTGSFTASVGKNYDVNVAAGTGAIVTWPSGSSGDEIRIRRSGPAAVILVGGISGGVINANMTVNGMTVRAVALAPGADLLFRRDSTGWTVREDGIGFVETTGLLQFITAQSGYTAVGGTSNDTWADQSGNGYDFTTNASATDPVYSATSGGGGNHPGVTFAGAEYMDIADAAWMNITAFTFAAAFKVTNRSNALVLDHRASSVGWGFAHSGVTAGKFNITLQATNHTDTGITFGETFHVPVIIHTTTINEVRFYLDGAQNSAVASSQSIGDAASVLRLGANSSSGASGFAGVYLGHILRNVVVTERVRKGDERWLRFAGIE